MMWRASSEAGVPLSDGRVEGHDERRGWTRVTAMVFDDALLLTREVDRSSNIIVTHAPIMHKDILSSDFLENGL